MASRIGAVHGDVTAIDILERGGGRVIDELVVALPEAVSVELLAKEIGAVDGVSVEHIRPVGRGAAGLGDVACCSSPPRSPKPAPGERLDVLVAGLLVAADADWAVAVRDGELVHRHGDPPETGWLLAFLAGSGHLDPARPSANEPGDVMWARLPSADATIAAGRATRAVHERERSRLALLARVVDHVL